MTLNLKKIYSESWNIFKKDWGKFVLFSFIICIVTLFPILGYILQFFTTLLLINAILHATKGESLKFSTFFLIKEVLKKTSVFLLILLWIYSIISNQTLSEPIFSALLGVFSLILVVIFFPIFCVVIEKDLSLKEAFSYSANLTKKLRLEILLIIFINLLICILGAFLFLIGITIAIPIVAISTVLIYIELEKSINNQTV